MKAGKSISILILLAGFALASWGTASSQDAPIPPPKMNEQLPSPPPPPPENEKMSGCGQADHVMNLPGITDDQKEKIKRIRLADTEKKTPLHNQMKEKEARLNTLLNAKNINTGEANKIADEIGGLMAQMLKTSIGTDQAIRAVLSDEQRIIFDSRPKPFLNPGKHRDPRPEAKHQR